MAPRVSSGLAVSRLPILRPILRPTLRL